MRAAVPGLATPHPLIDHLPSVYAEDMFTVRLTAALDTVLAPVMNTIDCVHGYLDPWLAPPDFVQWLAGWVGVMLDESWTERAQRAVVADAVELFRLRGTMTGLRRHLEAVVEGTVQIAESGGVSCSLRPRPETPIGVRHWVSVRVLPDDPDSVSEAAIEAVIRAAKPVHVLHSVEVVRRR